MGGFSTRPDVFPQEGDLLSVESVGFLGIIFFGEGFPGFAVEVVTKKGQSWQSPAAILEALH